MEKIQYCSTEIEQIRLIEADYQAFAFQRHYHLDIHIGLITQGEQKFFCRGAQHHVGQSQISIIPPDEVHDGEAATGAYSVSVFQYILSGSVSTSLNALYHSNCLVLNSRSLMIRRFLVSSVCCIKNSGSKTYLGWLRIVYLMMDFLSY